MSKSVEKFGTPGQPPAHINIGGLGRRWAKHYAKFLASHSPAQASELAREAAMAEADAETRERDERCQR